MQQSAAQMRCLIKVLPFILHDKLEPGSKLLRFLSTMGRIVQILFCPKLKHSILSVLSGLVVDHNQQFREIFPNADIINKLHHMFHDVECIEKSGPLNLFNCFIFEAKHGLLNDIAQACNNYKNLPKTIASVAQLSQGAIWGSKRDYVRKKYSYGLSSNIQFQDLLYANDVIDENKESFLSQNIIKTNYLKLYSTEYNIDSFVVIHSGDVDGGDQLPLFGKILEIFLVENKSSFIVYEEWPSVGFCEDLNAYNIENNNLIKLVEIENLSDLKPLNAWSSFRYSDELFICLNHFVF